MVRESLLGRNSGRPCGWESVWAELMDRELHMTQRAREPKTSQARLGTKRPYASLLSASARHRPFCAHFTTPRPFSTSLRHPDGPAHTLPGGHRSRPLILAVAPNLSASSGPGEWRPQRIRLSSGGPGFPEAPKEVEQLGEGAQTAVQPRHTLDLARRSHGGIGVSSAGSRCVLLKPEVDRRAYHELLDLSRCQSRIGLEEKCRHS